MNRIDSSEPGETSSCATEEAETESKSMQNTTLDARFNMVTSAGDNAMHGCPKPKIQKVIFWLRDHKDFKKYFEPRVVSLGPIHLGMPKYQLGEKYKLVLACDFIKSSGKGIRDLYSKIEEKIKELRDCYEVEVTKDYNDESLAWLLFLDGCAVLQYIYCATHKKFKDLNIKMDFVVFGQQDIFLLENQLPYRLLKWLMSLSEIKKELEDSINIYFPNQESLHSQEKPEELRISMDGEPIHLLDLRRTTLLGKPQPVSDIFQTRQEFKDWQPYLKLQGLKRVVIHLKPSRNKLNNCLRNISFAKFLYGRLYLPPITVDDTTKSKFLNLIAYEMCPNFQNDYGVTSYICFLDELIDEAKDVMDLRKAGILYHFLSSDEEVAQLFNDISKDLAANPEIYIDVKSQIHKQFLNKFHRLTFQFMHDHFGAPWTMITFFFSISALVLSILQTISADRSS